MSELILGIDTSNYTTSLAVVDLTGKVITDKRELLKVDLGKKGLRQSEALFQHIKKLPYLFEECVSAINIKKIAGVAISNKPRNITSSYMPVFVAGEKFGETIATSLSIPIYKFSHQEGHIKAIEAFNNIGDKFICFHLSGGTTEILKVTSGLDKKMNIECIGRTLDISLGQLIDRIGVSLKYPFPAGKHMDELALIEESSNLNAKEISITDMNINLSGLETYLIRAAMTYSKEEIAFELFTKILLCIQKLIKSCKNKYKDWPIIFAGGVSESKYLRKHISETVKFGNYGSDNAVGIALLGGNLYVDNAY